MSKVRAKGIKFIEGKNDLRLIDRLREGDGVYINRRLIYRTNAKKEVHTPSQHWIYSFSENKEEALNGRKDYYVYLKPIIDPVSSFMPFEKQTHRGFNEGFIVFEKGRESEWEMIEEIGDLEENP